MLKRNAEGVKAEWRLVKGGDRLFLSSGFGYAHEAAGGQKKGSGRYMDT